jgi:PHD/YefM family antitoxin component YafN of YafNO toxin-antitoxin module
MSTTTLSKAKKNLDSLLDEAVHSAEPVIIRREGKPDMALVVASELKQRRRKSHSEHLHSNEVSRKRLEASIADLEAGRVGWSGTWEEFQAMSKKMLGEAQAGSKPKTKSRPKKKPE